VRAEQWFKPSQPNTVHQAWIGEFWPPLLRRPQRINQANDKRGNHPIVFCPPGQHTQRSAREEGVLGKEVESRPNQTFRVCAVNVRAGDPTVPEHIRCQAFLEHGVELSLRHHTIGKCLPCQRSPWEISQAVHVQGEWWCEIK
jgi:hypothetical protein